MKITYHPLTETFVANAKYYEKDTLKGAGFGWNPELKAWSTKDKTVALRLRSKFDEAARAISAMDEAKQEETKSASNSIEPEDPTYSVPVPAGMELRPYQIAGVEFAMGRKNTLLADEMGVGKTATACGVINKLGPQRVLVVCPASLKLNWRKELMMWITGPTTIKILYSKGDHLVEECGAPHKGDGECEICVVNYDILDRFDLKAKNWDLMILDEVHVLKNKSAKRTVAVFGGGKTRAKPIPAGKILGLTGTPVQNRPSELWSLLRGLDGERWTSALWSKFHVRYCSAIQTKFGWDTSGADNLDELNTLLRGTIMMRRTKKQVLKDMPDKTRKTTPLETTAEIRKLLAAEEALQYIVEVGIKNADPEKLAIMQQFIDDRAGVEEEVTTIGELAKIRRMVGEMKAPLVVDFVKDMLDGGLDSVVIFAHHKTVVNELTAGLADYGVVRIVGDTPAKNRQQAVDLFQAEGGPRVFIGSITAAGVGITLTRASYTVFAEVDWVPGNLVQAEDRTHRIGQKNAVTIDYLVFDGSCDTKMISSVGDKNAVIKEIEK